MRSEPPPEKVLGSLILVTDRTQAEAAGHRLVDLVARAVDAGARTVLLREKDLPADERTALAQALTELLAPVDGALLVASSTHLAEALTATGVHLSAKDPHGRPLPAATDPDRRMLVGRSCHSVAELRAAEAAGVDYVTYSPIWATASKPGYGPALGLTGLADGVAAVPGLPVYALGGIGPGRAGPCRAAGAAGVAVMGAVMRAPDPASVVRQLLAELSSDEPRSSRSGSLA